MSRIEKSGDNGAHQTSGASRSSRKKKNSKGLYYIILVVLLAVLVFSCVKIITYFHRDRQQTEISDGIISDFVIPVDEGSGHSDGSAEGGEETSSEPLTPQPEQISVDFAALQSKYPDVVGYIYCANTRNTKGQYGISYPIAYTTETASYKGTTENLYLHHAIDGSENANGTIFVEPLCAPDFSCQNTIIYGHNMKTGAMFQPLEFYKNQYYYDAHPCMYIYTPTQNYRIDLFAGCVVEHDADIYALNVSQETLQKYVQNSTFKSKTGVPTGKIVTLSTCSYEISNGRYVVLGELVPID